MTTKPEMLNRIEATFSQLTPSEKRGKLDAGAAALILPFETAESVALTTGHQRDHCRALRASCQYRNPDDAKKPARSLSAPGMNERLDSATAAPALGSPPALPFAGGGCNHHVYQLAQTDVFKQIVHQLTHAEAVFVLGIQSTRGIANAFFSHRIPAPARELPPRGYPAVGLNA